MTNPQPLPEQYDFELYRGDTRVWEHHFTDDDGNAIDITDWEFLSEYRATTEDATVLAVDACEVTDAPGGIMRRTLTHAEAMNLPATIEEGSTVGRVAWDLQVTKPDGIVKTYLFNDSVKVRGDVSRADES